MTNTTQAKRSLSLFFAVVCVTVVGLALLAGTALADDMSDMSAQDMQAMTPTPVASATTMPADGSHNDMADMDMSKGSVNWLVIGGFGALIGGSTIAAVMIKQSLRRKTLAGELAGAGKQDV